VRGRAVSGGRLSAAALNRTLLHRQMLLARSDRPLARVVEGMGGIQMQYAPAGYIGLWSRMRDFGRPMLTRALEDRAVVQATLMRATIHTVSARDYWPVLAGIRRINREWYARVQARELAGIDMAAAAEATRAILADGPLRIAELTARLEARGFPTRTARLVGLWVDLVRVPPSGTWEQRRADRYGLADQWLPPERAWTEDEGIELLVRRYLGAFGPAPLRDIASWMGLNVGQIRHVVDRMELHRHRDEAGRPLVDLPDAELVDGDAPAPPRFIAVWDAMLLVHARRAEVLPEAYRSRIFSTKTPHSFNTFLLDGRVAGTWRFGGGAIELEPFRPLRKDERVELEAEAHRLAVLHA
jgi:hypothetical protein